MRLTGTFRTVFYIRNRTIILVASPLLLALCAIRILSNMRSGEPWLNWFAGLVVWLNLLLLALRRRLTLTQDGVEYTNFFRTVHIPWSQITRFESRKTLGIWKADGIEVWTVSPTLKEMFIDLNQFDRSWRYSALGTILRERAPHLFQ